MKINLTLTNEEIQAIDNATLETTTELKELDMVNEATSELLRSGDVIDTGAIKIERCENNVSIDIESKFVFWCLKFATKISKLVKVVYDMFSGLFEDIADGDYFRDEVVRYNRLDNQTEGPTEEGRVKVMDALAKLKDMIKACGKHHTSEVNEMLLKEMLELKMIIESSTLTYWPEAIELLENAGVKISQRSSDPDLWEELWTNISTFLIDNKD